MTRPPSVLRLVRRSLSAAALIGLVLGSSSLAQDELPAGVKKKGVDVWSDGTRLSGDVFYPPGFSPSDERPAIVLSHGWGGTRGHLNTAYAPFFAAEGFVVLTIDYRGWGDSDSRLVLMGEQPKPDDSGHVSVKVKAVREVVDPLDQTEDIRNAISYIQGEPGVDPERIGLWGSSYSGGHVIYVAAHDSRVKVTVSQVGSMDSKDIFRGEGFPNGLADAHALRVAVARGEAKPWPEIEARPGLTGTPFYARIGQYSPREVAHHSQAASLIIDAAQEELFDIKEHGRTVYALLKNRVPAKYVEIPDITHYGIYREAREKAVDLAIEWYREHL